ncbi:phage virion morphogenesis protein [Bacteroides pyogenes]|uniref:phage virion morphogenesis protein n=1 Tax=Bacteroides pyogenes TaxID=310300 RepID=UPI001BABEF34|nr:phage virion morphogenesis protein [Bacteroides pyogenes]MBR8705878.1 hypothetical protein [Bacteroides pyogenes]
MTIKEFHQYAKQKEKELERLYNDILPVKVGAIAKRHFQDNFRKGGFVDGGLTPWPVTRRQQSGGKSAASRYGPLLSSRTHLMRSVRDVPGRARTTIVSDLPYSRIHNEGGTIETHPNVTPRMRRFAWAKFFEAGGGGKKETEVPAEALKWKKLALTRKAKLDIRVYIPQRKFIGASRELEERISEKIINETRKVLGK